VTSHHDSTRTSAQHNALIWPAALCASVMIAGLSVIVATGHNTDDLVRAVGALFSIASTAVSTGAWVRSTQAAKQTNGDLDSRIATGVQQGITVALQQAQGAPPRAARPRRSAPDVPIDKIAPPAV
jgi:hypothetical protein